MSAPPTKKSKISDVTVSSEDQAALDDFKRFLRIRTVHPTPDYESSTAFLLEMAKKHDLASEVYALESGFPVVIMSWYGKEQHLPTVLLNSHVDVVPVEADKWKHDPFSAFEEENGDIYARGTQDMKCVCIQHLEAVGRLKKSGFVPKRTIHLTFVPEEEIAGLKGMKLFVRTKRFEELNVGCALDEGLASESDTMTLFYGERAMWWLRITANGNVGHGSRFVENTAVEKIHKVVGQFLEFRRAEEARLRESTTLRLGDVTTVNVTNVQLGVGQPNVVASSASAVVDIRIAPTVDLKEFETRLQRWLRDAGCEQCEFIAYADDNRPSSIDEEDKWWSALTRAFDALKLVVDPQVFPAGTDSRYLRAIGLPAYGFSPMRDTPIRLHDHNEFINRDVFLKGIPIFMRLLKEISMV